jgi:hypothetical protein
MAMPPLTAQERVILFCAATGISHAAVGITAHAMQSMAVKGSSSMIARAGPMRLQTADARLSGKFLRTLICPNAMPRAALGEAAGALND